MDALWELDGARSGALCKWRAMLRLLSQGDAGRPGAARGDADRQQLALLCLLTACVDKVGAVLKQTVAKNSVKLRHKALQVRRSGGASGGGREWVVETGGLCARAAQAA